MKTLIQFLLLSLAIVFVTTNFASIISLQNIVGGDTPQCNSNGVVTYHNCGTVAPCVNVQYQRYPQAGATYYAWSTWLCTEVDVTCNPLGQSFMADTDCLPEG